MMSLLVLLIVSFIVVIIPLLIIRKYLKHGISTMKPAEPMRIASIIMIIISIILIPLGKDIDNDYKHQAEYLLTHGDRDETGTFLFYLGIVLLIAGFILLIVALVKKANSSSQYNYNNDNNNVIQNIHKFKICNKCGKSITDNAKFCDFCGSPQKEKKCSNCGCLLTPDTIFCIECGQKYVESQGVKTEEIIS